MAPEALTNAREIRHYAAACCVIVVALALTPFTADAARRARATHSAREHLPDARLIPYPRLESPIEIPSSQYAPVAWSDIAGWNEDDHLAAYKAFRVSCMSIAEQRNVPTDPKALGSMSDQQLFDIIRKGKGDKMPPEDAGRAKDDEVWNLVIYLRGFSKNQPASAPAAPVPAPAPQAPGK